MGTTHTQAQYDDLMRSSTFDRNTFVHDVDQSFGVPGGRRLDFVGWQTDTGQDPNSSFSIAALVP